MRCRCRAGSAGQTLNAEERAELEWQVEKEVLRRGSRVLGTDDEVRSRRWDFTRHPWHRVRCPAVARDPGFRAIRLLRLAGRCSGACRPGCCGGRAGGRDPRGPPGDAGRPRRAEGARGTAGPRSSGQTQADSPPDGRTRHRQPVTCATSAESPSGPECAGRAGPGWTGLHRGGPDVRWVGDITYLPLGGSWMYLATVIDLHSRRLVGWSVAGPMHTRLVADAREAAVAARGGLVDGVIFHSDTVARPIRIGRVRGLCRCHRIRRSIGGVDSSYASATRGELLRLADSGVDARGTLEQPVSGEAGDCSPGSPSTASAVTTPRSATSVRSSSNIGQRRSVGSHSPQ
ncbi:Integrase core domain-containing protein [Streptomyces sp. TLI_053]|nr:Integrase core domain-containing protein [Streptomyces sp. TLI_053]